MAITSLLADLTETVPHAPSRSFTALQLGMMGLDKDPRVLKILSDIEGTEQPMAESLMQKQE